MPTFSHTNPHAMEISRWSTALKCWKIERSAGLCDLARKLPNWGVNRGVNKPWMETGIMNLYEQVMNHWVEFWTCFPLSSGNRLCWHYIMFIRSFLLFCVHPSWIHASFLSSFPLCFSLFPSCCLSVLLFLLQFLPVFHKQFSRRSFVGWF